MQGNGSHSIHVRVRIWSFFLFFFVFLMYVGQWEAAPIPSACESLKLEAGAVLVENEKTTMLFIRTVSGGLVGVRQIYTVFLYVRVCIYVCACVCIYVHNNDEMCT